MGHMPQIISGNHMKTYRVERHRRVVEEKYVKEGSAEMAQSTAELLDDWDVCDEEIDLVTVEER